MSKIFSSPVLPEWAGKIFPDKKSVDAGPRGTDKIIPLFLRQMTKGGKGCPEVQFRIVSLPPDETLIVGNRHFLRRTESRIIFADHDPGGDGFNGLPYPIIIAVDIDAQKSYVPAIRVRGNKLVDILPGNKTV